MPSILLPSLGPADRLAKIINAARAVRRGDKIDVECGTLSLAVWQELLGVDLGVEPLPSEELIEAHLELYKHRQRSINS
jgi:hypothetical protein